MYIDTLDGNITQEFYDQKSMEWRTEQDKTPDNIEEHKNVDRSYLDEGIKLLELSQKAVRKAANAGKTLDFERCIGFELHLEGWSPLSEIPPTL